MPEEKKESFTFSDKIKSSKPAGTKSFAKSSSKIGRDGKPRQTLFERTRRDAPFFIAALVALLLLPFLYKYSGQSSEDTLLTPGSEESQFDPERYGFDTAMVEDADGQIAQLSGRSSFDLIKGWGNQEEDYGDRDDLDFDAESSASASASGEYEAEGRYDAERHSRTDIDEEENITNIYKRRARAGTRAAFRRTQIGDLKPRDLKRAGGGRLNVNPWGGSLKDAAKKVKASGPRNAPKPVSLQPLRAGGPARSSFGQGAAAAARKGLDNMGKSDAKQALHDAYVKPVGPTRSGGIDLFADGRTGGNGKLDHNINIGKGQTPWWWDMMKTRMQKEWEARFNYKWGWINWATDIAKNILKGLINCLITGDDGGDMGKMFGYGAGGGGKDPTCCGYSAKKLAPIYGSENVKNLEAFCTSAMRKKIANDLGIEGGCEEYKGGIAAGARAGLFKSRLDCLGIGASGYASGSLGLNAANGSGDICDEMPYLYRVIPSGQARNWHIYTYVVARNYFPDSLKGKFPVHTFPKGGNLLCVKADAKHGGSGLNHTGGTSAGAGYGTVANGKKNAKGTPVTEQRSTASETNHSEKVEIRRNTLEIDPNLKNHSCVIYVQNSGTFDYEVFKNEIIDQFKKMLGKGNKTDNEKLAQQAFRELDLMFVGSVAMKDNLAAGKGSSVHKLYDGLLPMLYWEFEDAYIMHKGVTNRQNGRDNDISKKKWRVENEDLYIGQECSFENWHMDCMDFDQPTAQLRTHATKYENGKWSVDASRRPNPNEFIVSAEFVNANAPKEEEEGAAASIKETGMRPTSISQDGFTLTYTLNMDSLLKDRKEGLVGNIVWTIKRGADGRISKQTCPFGLGDVQESLPETKQGCEPGEIEESYRVTASGKQCRVLRKCLEDRTWEKTFHDDPDDQNCKEEELLVPQGKLQDNGERKRNIVVSFFERLTKIPCEKDITVISRRQEGAKPGCLKWEGCKLTVDNARLYQPLDEQTKAYVKAAKAKFDDANKSMNITLGYEEDKLTVANLVDAIMINPDSYNNMVPKNTVCLLGKTIGGNARDPQAPAFDNMFGAFFAFFGYDAASFPSKFTTDCADGHKKVSNRRFPCSSQYWWGGYVDNGNRSGYKREVDNGPWRTFPLAALLREKLPTRDDGLSLVERNDEKSRITFHRRYKDMEVTSQCNYGDEMMPREKVLEYIDILCKNGEQIKPKAWKPCPQGKKDPQNRGKQGTKNMPDCPEGDC